jgi:hypothetical protein
MKQGDQNGRFFAAGAMIDFGHLKNNTQLCSQYFGLLFVRHKLNFDQKMDGQHFGRFFKTNSSGHHGMKRHIRRQKWDIAV